MTYFDCPQAAFGEHLERPGEGVCVLCGKRVGETRPVAWRRNLPRPVDVWGDELDPRELT